MAVLVPQDWHPPRDHTMDAPSPSSVNPSLARQRTSPPNDHNPSPPPMHPQQPYPYPVQQQQAGWTPPHPQQQFYPAFYQNPHPQPYPMHGHLPHPPPGQIHPQGHPYYDPANAQFAAQWTYQQMMFNAQQHAHQMSHASSLSGQRSRAGSASTANGEYFPPNQLVNYNLFPSGTPPPHPSQLPPNGYPAGQGDQHSQPQFTGFHPYRRPNRQGSHHQDPPSHPGDWRSPQPPSLGTPFQPPYARSDAAGSSTSVNSNNSGSSRPRTNSNQGSQSGSGGGGGSQSGHSNHGHGRPNGHHGHTPRSGSTSSSSNPQQSNVPPQRRAGPSSSLNGSSAMGTGAAPPRQPAAPPVATTATSSSSAHANNVALRRPSPLSQGTFTAAEKRMSRDDSDLTAMLEPAPGVRSGGLKGRLRRALSLNAGHTLNEEEEDDATKAVSKSPTTPRHGASASTSTPRTATGDDESTATVQKKKSRSLFNSRLNRSTDNISLSSTMSSASMVIRKLGSIGKLTRRNSLAGITSFFKDKKEKEKDGAGEGGDSKKDKKKKKGEKGVVAEASVSHVTAELDSSDWSSDMTGLSPAAMLARQHTLKSNAEAAARAKAEAEAKATVAVAPPANQQDGTPVPTTWEKNTTNRQGGENAAGRAGGRASEDGTAFKGPVVEEESDSDEDHSDDGHHGPQNYSMEGWEDDEDWAEPHDEENETIRVGMERTSLDDEEMEPWAINVRRSVERSRVPARGILKNGSGYDQDQHVPSGPIVTRHRANSYDSAPQGPDVAPLGHLPSPDPAQIDGLAHKHPSPHHATSFLPPLSFESKSLSLDETKETDVSSDTPTSLTVTTTTTTTTTATATVSTERSIFSHPNISEPALSTMFMANPPTLTHRSATAPAKRLAFATNLSVYDTFPSSVYDRRSEPATWSRLTPALAQRIKEELNSFKMEEMEVHTMSRVHTQFFV